MLIAMSIAEIVCYEFQYYTHGIDHSYSSNEATRAVFSKTHSTETFRVWVAFSRCNTYYVSTAFDADRLIYIP